MCDINRWRLIAWVDGELPVGEASAVKEHIGECAECRNEVRRVQALSRDIEQYCAAMAPASHSPARWWIPVAAAALVLLAAGLISTSKRVPVPVIIARAPVLASPSPERAVDPIRITRPVRSRRHAPRRTNPVKASAGEPGVLLVIPMDELLPVGAAPPGALLVGRLTLDAGGLPGRLRLE